MKEGRIKSLLKRSKGKNHEVLFHHRLSTSTADVPNACHPFSTKNYFENNYVGVHNGMIWNDNILEKQHEALGIEYVSRQKTGEFNDSEALIYDIARYLEGEVTELTAEGSIAFIVVKRNKDGKPVTLFFGRNTGNPLKMKRTENSLTISSEGAGEDCKPNTLYSYDYDTGELDERYMYIPTYSNYNPRGSSFRSNSSSRSTSLDYMGYESGYVESGQGLYEDIYENGDVAMGFYNSEARSMINDTKWTPRFGLEAKIRGDLLTESAGDFAGAAILALVEAQEAEEEENRVNECIMASLSQGAYDGLQDYWYYVNAYKNAMIKMAEDLEEVAAVNVVKTTEEPQKKKDGTLVFPSGIQVSPEEQSLLPITTDNS